MQTVANPRLRRYVKPHRSIWKSTLSAAWESTRIAAIDGLTAILRAANSSYSEAEFEQTRKDFFDEYSASERRAMAAEDRRHKEHEEECARLWHY